MMHSDEIYFLSFFILPASVIVIKSLSSFALIAGENSLA